MNRIGASGMLVLAIVVILLALLVFGLSGCQIENRGATISWLQPPPPVVVDRADLTLDEPVLRVLEVCCGRVRLIVQDPTTRRYKMVGP